jgi:hypothetical protein
MATTMSGKWSVGGGKRRFTFSPMGKWPKKRSAAADVSIAPSKGESGRERKITTSRVLRAPGRPNTPTGVAVAKAKTTDANPNALKSTSKRNTVPKKKALKFPSSAPKAKMPPAHPGTKPSLGRTRP